MFLSLRVLSGHSPSQPSPPQEHARTSRPLTAKEGQAIINAAREHEPEVRGKPDCSHLVHQVYRFAGYEYAYASSFDLYSGTENFVRVKTPQPGDLIAWPGHVGIVIDAVRHTFYSSVRSGMRAEFYDGPYWRARGKPRFYRYRVENPGKLMVARARAPSRARATPEETAAGPVKQERDEPTTSTSAQARKTERAGSAEPGAGASNDAAATSPSEVPTSILIASGDKRPTREEAAEGISELSNSTGNLLRAEDPSKAGIPVVIIDQLNVERVETKRDRGWAHLKIDSRVSIVAERATLKPRHEKVRWELRRTESGWEALLPAERAYVSRDAAVRALAARLAQLTQSEGAANHEDRVVREEAQLTSLLSVLLQSK
jgi:hypothetical protein